MKHVTEFRDPALVRQAIDSIRRTMTRPWTLMEVCGGQTHSILRHGLDELLPQGLELVHGPGCPVCVTPLQAIDRAIAIASVSGVVFTSFGDMLRVPGSATDLMHVRASGGDVRVVTSPLHAVRIARENPDRQVVFFAIGFETTAPPNALSVLAARESGLRNFSVLVSHVRVPPAMRAILTSPGNRVQAFLAAGHVCTVMGLDEYAPIAAEFGVPIVVTGFEPVDLVHGIGTAVRRLEERRPGVENAYGRAVSQRGNPAAQRVIAEVFEECDRTWRGIGPIPGSGWRLRPTFAEFDAERRFDVGGIAPLEPAACRSGLVLQGRIRPNECPAFGRECTPERPLGATMVSSEGACSAWWRYRRDATGGVA
ncbi:MAG: hydrogenase formation protein HypD [Planctomycetes bacterium]|nr:hydrogenase formation protein HypD [Planctomycetota bacterium]